MHNFMKNLPEPVLGLIIMLLGGIILLDAFGVIYAPVLVIIGAGIAVWYGFVLMQGPKKVLRMLENVVHPNNKK